MNAKSTKVPVRRVPTPKPDAVDTKRQKTSAAADDAASKKLKASAETAEAEAKAKAAKEEERKAAKEADEKAKLAKQAKAEKQLSPLATEILARLEKAALMDSKADDHRLSAAIQFGKAKQVCEEAGLSFKQWAEKNIPNHSYENIRKLVRIGTSPDPKQALADLRDANKQANKAHREVKKIERSKPQDNISKEESSAPARASTPFQRAEAAFSEMKEDHVKDFVHNQAAQLGLQVLTDKEVKALQANAAALAGKKGEEPHKALLRAVMALPAQARVDFLFDLSVETGYKLVPADAYKAYQAWQKENDEAKQVAPVKEKAAPRRKAAE